MSDLIEQLGGYRMAKEVRGNIPKDGRSYTITRDDTGISFNTSELHKALLEYRRANNIFEDGDYYVYLYEWDELDAVIEQLDQEIKK